MKEINKKKIIYLDNASATPLEKKVARFMEKNKGLYSNASSIHSEGIKARNAIQIARKKIADLIFAHSDEIIFTGSGTESNALAILGTITNYQLPITDKKILPHIVTSTIEHPAVLENCKMLEKSKKAEVTYLSINEQGLINPKDVKKALKENTILVSVMYANNEIGTIQPIMEIAKEIRHFKKIRLPSDISPVGIDNLSLIIGNKKEYYPLFHTDACQAMNYLDTTNIEKLGVDMMSFNSSKIYGPKGIGILYKKRHIELSPIYGGGGQEMGVRSGTENVEAIAGASCALELVNKIKDKEKVRLIKLRDYAIEKILILSKSSGYPIILNGDKILRLPNNINITLVGISSELVVIELDAKGILVSSKSACKSEDPNESYVIEALRTAQNMEISGMDGSLRISLGRFTKKKDMDSFIKALEDILKKYRQWK